MTAERSLRLDGMVIPRVPSVVNCFACVLIVILFLVVVVLPLIISVVLMTIILPVGDDLDIIAGLPKVELVVITGTYGFVVSAGGSPGLAAVPKAFIQTLHAFLQDDDCH